MRTTAAEAVRRKPYLRVRILPSLFVIGPRTKLTKAQIPEISLLMNMSPGMYLIKKLIKT